MGVALLTAVLGMYWDISLHIDNGRDAGPLANPAHYLILIGLYGVLRGRRPSRSPWPAGSGPRRPPCTWAATGGRPSAAS